MKNGAQPFFTQRSPRAFILSGLVAIIVLGVHEPLRSAALTLLRLPFTVATTAVGVLVNGPRLPSLSRENAFLQSALMQRQVELAQLQERLRHVQAGQTLMKSAPIARGVVASIIGRSTIPTQQTILLNRGERDGLSLESIVIDVGGVVGRVIELHRASCLVLLLTDPESRVAGLVERSRETGLLVGRSQGACEFIYLDIDADIHEGDRVVTAGLGGMFPKGLVLGTVVRLARDAAAGTTTAWVTPAARLGRLEEVFCVFPQEPSVQQGGKPERP